MKTERLIYILSFIFVVLVSPSCDSDNSDRPLLVEDSYTIAIVSDIQVYTQESDNPILDSVAKFINNSDYIHRTLLAGDLTNNNLPNQWINAKSFINSLSYKDVSFCLGNHDYGENGGTQNRSSLCFSNSFLTFPKGVSESYQGMVDNTVSFFDIFDKRYGVISTEFGPRDEVLSWADSVAKANPDKYFMILTHAYLNESGNIFDIDNPTWSHCSPTDYPFAATESVNDGMDIWNKLIDKNPNIRFVICGHSPIKEGFFSRTDKNSFGKEVYTFMVNYQFFPNGGDGYVGMLSFFPDGMLKFSIYSPFLKQFDNCDAIFNLKL